MVTDNKQMKNNKITLTGAKEQTNNNQFTIAGGYQAQGKLNLSNPPKVGTGIPPKNLPPKNKEE